MADLDAPVILIGAARSGTTVLGEEVLAQFPGVAYWGEPQYVWRYGHAFRPWDSLGPQHAKPKIVQYIRRRFREFARQHRARRVVQKTPANSRRVGFVRQVFPSALFVHVIRDGRDVALSAAEEWRGQGTRAYDSRGLRAGSPLWQVWSGITTWSRLGDRVRDLRSFVELLAAAPRGLSFVVRRTLHPSWLPWGPRIPGLWAIRLNHSLLECCAIQWAWCVQAAESEKSLVPEDQWLEVRYEALIADPEREIERLAHYLGAAVGREKTRAIASRIVRRELPQWPRRLKLEEVNAIERQVGFLLRSLGYPLVCETRASGEGGHEGAAG